MAFTHASEKACSSTRNEVLIHPYLCACNHCGRHNRQSSDPRV